MLQYIKFGQNPSFGSRDRVQTSYYFLSNFDIQSAGVTLKMKSRSPKPNNSFPSPSAVSMQVWPNPLTGAGGGEQTRIIFTVL